MSYKLTFNQKKEALSNALISYKFPEKYFIQNADTRLGHKFAITSISNNGGIMLHSSYMTYEEMNAFFMGYNKALNNPLK